MDVIGYDPFLTPAAAARLDAAVKTTADLDTVYAEADYLTLHVPLNADTKGLINADTLAKMKDCVRIMNFSRDGLVNSADILAGIKSGKIAAYVTDFATDDILGEEGVIAIPHLGASTPESEDNCAMMAADQIKAYIETGAVINSVNLPRVELAKAAGTRVTVIHKSDDAVTAQIKAAAAEAVTAVRGDVAYTVIDTEADVADAIAAIDGVIKVRVIK